LIKPPPTGHLIGKVGKAGVNNGESDATGNHIGRKVLWVGIKGNLGGGKLRETNGRRLAHVRWPSGQKNKKNRADAFSGSQAGGGGHVPSSTILGVGGHFWKKCDLPGGGPGILRGFGKKLLPD